MALGLGEPSCKGSLVRPRRKNRTMVLGGGAISDGIKVETGRVHLS